MSSSEDRIELLSDYKDVLHRSTIRLNETELVLADTVEIGETILNNLYEFHNTIIIANAKAIDVNNTLTSSNSILNRMINRMKQHKYITYLIILTAVIVIIMILILMYSKHN